MPLVQRPTREHALQHARALFARGDRVDMGPLAQELGIGRTTLYRWVGDRERLLGDVLGAMTDDTWEIVAAQAGGTGVDRAVDTLRRFMEVTSSFPPLKAFAERESQLALRVLCTPRATVPSRIGAGIRRAFEANVPPDRVPSDELIDIMVQLGTTLEWTPIVIGQPPSIDRAIALLHWLLRRD